MVKFTEQIADIFKDKLNLDNDTTEIIDFGLKYVFLTLANLAVVLFIGWLLGYLGAVVAVVAGNAGLRIFAGGAHCSSPGRCLVLGALTIPFLGKGAAIFAPLLMPYYGFIEGLIFLCVLALTWKLAPVDSPAKPVLTERHRKRLRLFSFLAVAALTFFSVFFWQKGDYAISLGLLLGMVWEAFMLTRWGYKFTGAADRLLSFSIGKGCKNS